MFLENSTHVILDKKRGKVESVICICFPDQRSEFITYTLLCAKYVIKIFQKKNMKNSENYKKVKWRSNPPNSKMFLALLIQIKKNVFPKKDTFNYASNPRMLYLSKIGPENISDHFLAPIIFKSMKFVGHCPSVIKLCQRMGGRGSEGLCSSEVILLGITIDNQLPSKQQIEVTPRNTRRTTVRKHLLNFIPFGE